MNKALFSVPNHQCEDCGEPPVLPPSEARGFYRSYFENCHGEQWIFLVNQDTKEIKIHGGDCGWQQPMRLIRLRLTDFLQEAETREKTEPMAGLAGQTTMAGVCLIRPILGASKTREATVTLVVDEQGHLVNCNQEEHVWLDACLLACRVELTPLTLAEWTKTQDGFFERAKRHADDAEEPDDPNHEAEQ